ncbi:MAG TPA: ribosome assembly RNA-binding protein YhbY [Polyangiaceae bacterium]|jgi:RNA-binding protein|nr:MAG: RNA-binding protein YhbY [Deltaproteobacteria bacterium ADurb.Bin207]HNS99286.1 ribosome assembly RNA-binding protein YhbY [Polyangiaceae bacterium]HNZ23980.1 ribosome assembly RNA-binding protein YhbY [Polyangiaceae bacterium]HOD21769.1 ribosome assembly RNA-binding protein YhbY [Polyangiaceae bacterium]HOE49479.1 ribosome assembly RNA-binding protein YhbY [Polyangiaceae bacterium]
MNPLTGKQKRHLRALGHALDPVIRVGKAGVTDSLLAAVSQALEDHELVKIKILEESPQDQEQAAVMIAQATQATEVQVLGRTVLLYRPHPEKPKITLP